MVERREITDEKHDILTHPGRRNLIYILTVDPILATDIYERIEADERLKDYLVIRPRSAEIDETVVSLAKMAQGTIAARLLIFDVRRASLPKLRKAYRDIVGFNRKDFNKLCYTILIGDGPPTLFQNGRGLDVFTLYLADHRVDFHPAVFFYDPLLHYEPGEVQPRAIDDEFLLRDDLPQRLLPYFQEGRQADVDAIRRFFRATGRDEEVRKKRRHILRSLYKKRFTEQFPGHEEQMKALISAKGLHLATEKLNLYPLYFEDWVHRLMEKAKKNSKISTKSTP